MFFLVDVLYRVLHVLNLNGWLNLFFHIPKIIVQKQSYPSRSGVAESWALCKITKQAEYIWFLGGFINTAYKE